MKYFQLLVFLSVNETATRAEILKSAKEDADELLDKAVAAGLVAEKTSLWSDATYRITSAGEKALLGDEDDDNDDKVPTAFLVHGHDTQTMREVQALLQNHFRDELVPKVLMDEPNLGCEQLYAKLDRTASESDIAVIVFTADDEAYSKATPVEREGRARPNVLIELGFFLARVGTQRTFILRDPNAKIPSDVLGGMVISLTGQWMYELTRDIREYLDQRTGRR